MKQSLYECTSYMEDVKANIARIDLAPLDGKRVYITGGTGMIGSYITDMLLFSDYDITVYVLGRSALKMMKRFPLQKTTKNLVLVEHDINTPIDLADPSWAGAKVDYMIHAASNTHPRAYAEDPIGTITANILGAYNLLEFFDKVNGGRFVFLSSVEIYGENRGDTESFDESYLGYIDCNTLRAGYPESKRAGEALCQAYIAQKNSDIIIPRLSRSYGPTLLKTDTKALSQFIHSAVDREDIVLKSAGTQEYSYGYVGDQAVAILNLMLHAETGEAVNVASEGSDVTLRRLAEYLAEVAGTKVVFEMPDETEAKGYSTATRALLDLTKLHDMGYRSAYDMRTGLSKTVEILRELAYGEA